MVAKGYSFMRKQRWRDVFTSADVRVDGTTVLACLRTKDAVNPQSFVVEPDTLLASVAGRRKSLGEQPYADRNSRQKCWGPGRPQRLAIVRIVRWSRSGSLRSRR